MLPCLVLNKGLGCSCSLLSMPNLTVLLSPMLQPIVSIFTDCRDAAPGMQNDAYSYTVCPSSGRSGVWTAEIVIHGSAAFCKTLALTCFSASKSLGTVLCLKSSVNIRHFMCAFTGTFIIICRSMLALTRLYVIMLNGLTY